MPSKTPYSKWFIFQDNRKNNEYLYAKGLLPYLYAGKSVLYAHAAPLFMQKFATLFFIVFTLPFAARAQSDLKIGQWKTFIPYHFGTYVTQSAEKIYYTTEGSIVVVDKTDRSLSFLDKSQGLTEVTMGPIKYNPSNKTLLITYDDSNIDLVKPDGSVMNIGDIKDNDNIIGDKAIYNIYFNNQIAYLSCGFGVVQLDMASGDFISTTFTQTKVSAATLFNNQLYAATDKGVFAVSLDPNVNIADFNNWKLLGKAQSLPNGYISHAVAVFNNALYFDVSDALYYLNNGSAVKVYNESGFGIGFLSAEGAHLLAGFVCQNDCNGKVLIFNADQTYKNSAIGCVNRPAYAVEDEKGKIWYADGFDAFRHEENPTDAYCATQNFPNGSPITATSSDLALSAGGNLYAAYGGLKSNLSDQFSSQGFGSYFDGAWHNHNSSNAADKIMRDSNAFQDCYRVAVNPFTQKVYIGTFTGGLLQMTDEKIDKVYNYSNSALQRANGDPTHVRVGGLAFDGDGNLWVANNIALNPVVVLKKDGTWKTMQRVENTSLYQVVVDSAGYKWFITSDGLLVYDSGKSVDDLSDDRSHFFSAGSFPGEFAGAVTNALAVDVEGRIWVGTSAGALTFDCGSDPFASGCGANRIISQLDGISEYLLRQKNVLCIAIDGANRKWFGTSSGLFVQSPDGTTEVAKFNTQNSPLLSDVVTSLAINQKTGQVYVGTDKGLMVYQSDALAGGDVNRDTAFVFPNPVRPGYNGPIAIRGLARNADVKITDVNGRLVFETTALGGQAIWYGKDFSGRKVAPGVYLVFAANTQNPDASDAIVTKVLFMD